MISKGCTIKIESAPDSRDVGVIHSRLKEFNNAIVGDDNHRELVVFLRDVDNNLAPSFYEKHGYRIFGELRDLPSDHDHSRVYLRKVLKPE